ncbi:MAG: metallophosphoesterase [Candidatus Syntrophosphaera sp.]|nr:metallophosphoesterase [Candidatus Syntrophosphaera sp.]
MKLILSLLLICVSFGLAAVSPYNALGDTLTVIMSPILNVPAIHVPGETLFITCVAPASSSNWQAQLRHGSKTIDLNISSSQFLTNPERWELQATVPSVPVFELYDLRVNASGGIEDVTANAVRVIPTRKSSFYFVHITDLHLPTRIYYPDYSYDTDSTSVNDFRSVIQDINLINPEFVLLTGDLLNEGELENFAGQHWYGWTQRLLEELEVPVFVTAGNHDIGGWNATPPPQGSARRNWWRYFGWPWLDNPDSNWPRHTQDYDFFYGDLHFIGLEAYDNYDNWRANIYGGQSFIYTQMLWLNERLAFQPDKTKILFHHYDFSDQINLNALGADMELWGHIHYNSGSIYSHPYTLATRSVCNGNRAYRVVRVNGSQLQPQNTIYAGATGGSLYASFYPSNTASADSVLAIVSNNQPLAFEHSLLKFRMPPGNHGYSVINGVLSQVDRGAQENVCHVNVDLAANSVKYVSIASNSTAVEDPIQPPFSLISSAHPNPFASQLTVRLDSRAANPTLRIYNLRGELVREFGPSPDGKIVWDGRFASGRVAPAGIYLLQARQGKASELRRVVKIASD